MFQPVDKARCVYFSIRGVLAADPDWVKRNCPGGIRGAVWQLERYCDISLDKTKEAMADDAEYETLVRDLNFATNHELYESALARTRGREYPSEDD